MNKPSMKKPEWLTLDNAKSVAKNILFLKFSSYILSWIITASGNASECVFMLASLWMSVNASVHPFVLQFMSENQAMYFTWLASMAYVVLPECILLAAVITTRSHIRMFLYTIFGSNKKDAFTPAMWALLFGIPTLIFVILSVYTVDMAVKTMSLTFVYPSWMIQIRAIAGYTYAFSSMLYLQIGTQQEKDRLSNKDAIIAELQQETERINAEWQAENNRIKAELNQQKTVIAQSKKQNEELQKAFIDNAESALQAYSQDCINWLNSGIKSVLPDEIPPYTGHSKRKITEAIKAGKFRLAPNNKERILVSSLVEWLKENPPSAANKERDTGPMLKIVNE